MNKRERINSKQSRKFNYESKKMSSSDNSKKNKDLPWWVELLFVQIGLPDKLLINILKTKKKSKELFKNDKKSLLTLLFAITTLTYFYPYHLIIYLEYRGFILIWKLYFYFISFHLIYLLT